MNTTFINIIKSLKIGPTSKINERVKCKIRKHGTFQYYNDLNFFQV